MLSTIALFIFPVLLAYAGCSDLLTMRIANWLVLLVVVAYFALALLSGISLAAIGVSAGCALVVLLVAFAFFAFGWIGGGDAKLVAAITLWIGFDQALPYLLYSALLGGSLTLLLLSVRRFPLPPFFAATPWIGRLHNPKTGVPYGIALAAAGLLVYPQTAIFSHFIN
jgi:prepilin peptidase CpaA